MLSIPYPYMSGKMFLKGFTVNGTLHLPSIDTRVQVEEDINRECR